jgi:hypothetical protein
MGRSSQGRANARTESESIYKLKKKVKKAFEGDAKSQ